MGLYGFIANILYMLSSLSNKLRQSIEKLTRGSIDKEAVESFLKDVQRALIESDVDIELVFELSENIKKKALSDLPSGLTRKEYTIKTVYEELARILGDKKSEVSLVPKKILMIGLFGSGKTSTTIKLARFYQKKGLEVSVIACDTVRPAAYEQLEQLAKKIDVSFYGKKEEKDSSTVLKECLKHAKEDVIIIDSSGRNALDKDLIEEIKKLNEIAKPDEKILIIPADIGQAAKEQSLSFHNALNITDVIVTKLDATAKGGGALTACYTTNSKVKFIAVGETVEDLEQYDPQKFVARLLGMPDLETLLEKAKSVVDEKSAQKVIEGDFTLDEFYTQIESMQKMGPLSQIMDMVGLGGMGSKMPLDVQENKMKKWKFIIQSMTKEEKRNPDLISSSRARRIAKGSGCLENDVRDLISNYSKLKKMMKKLNPNKLKRGGMSGLFRQMGMK